MAALSLSVAVFAQEDGNRDADGKIVRGPYETNGIWDNWSVGVGGGINLIGHKLVRPLVGADAEINVSRWLTPCYGIRAGVQGVTGRGSASEQLDPFFYTEKDGRYVNTIGFIYAHGDFLWNFTNEVWGYKESRVYNCVPYLHAGYLVTGYRDNNDKLWWPRELALGGGIYNLFKITKRLDITLDVRGVVYNGRALGTTDPAYDLTVALGLNVNLGKTNWKRSAGVTPQQWKSANDALDDANDALEQAKAEAAAKDKALADKDKALADKDAEIAKVKADAEAMKKDLEKDLLSDTVYFKIGETVLPTMELWHLDYYVKSIIEAIEVDRTIVIVGNADENTGSDERNLVLAENRAKYVHDLLVKKYGIDPARIVLKSGVVRAADDKDAPIYRSAVISL